MVKGSNELDRQGSVSFNLLQSEPAGWLKWALGLTWGSYVLSSLMTNLGQTINNSTDRMVSSNRQIADHVISSNHLISTRLNQLIFSNNRIAKTIQRSSNQESSDMASMKNSLMSSNGLQGLIRSNERISGSLSEAFLGLTNTDRTFNFNGVDRDSLFTEQIKENQKDLVNIIREASNIISGKFSEGMDKIGTHLDKATGSVDTVAGNIAQANLERANTQEGLTAVTLELKNAVDVVANNIAQGNTKLGEDLQSLAGTISEGDVNIVNSFDLALKVIKKLKEKLDAVAQNIAEGNDHLESNIGQLDSIKDIHKFGLDSIAEEIDSGLRIIEGEFKDLQNGINMLNSELRNQVGFVASNINTGNSKLTELENEVSGVQGAIRDAQQKTAQFMSIQRLANKIECTENCFVSDDQADAIIQGLKSNDDNVASVISNIHSAAAGDSTSNGKSNNRTKHNTVPAVVSLSPIGAGIGGLTKFKISKSKETETNESSTDKFDTANVSQNPTHSSDGQKKFKRTKSKEIIDRESQLYADMVDAAIALQNPEFNFTKMMSRKGQSFKKLQEILNSNVSSSQQGKNVTSDLENFLLDANITVPPEIDGLKVIMRHRREIELAGNTTAMFAQTVRNLTEILLKRELLQANTEYDDYVILENDATTLSPIFSNSQNASKFVGETVGQVLKVIDVDFGGLFDGFGDILTDTFEPMISGVLDTVPDLLLNNIFPKLVARHPVVQLMKPIIEQAGVLLKILLETLSETFDEKFDEYSPHIISLLRHMKDLTVDVWTVIQEDVLIPEYLNPENPGWFSNNWNV